MNHQPAYRNHHQLLSVDPETRLGLCDRCGQTAIVKTGHKDDTQYWGCKYAHLQLDRDGNPKVKGVGGDKIENRTTVRNGHRLLEFSVEKLIGKCERCGEVDIVRCGSNPGTQYWGCSGAYPRQSSGVRRDLHKLIDVVAEDRTATCSQCGPVLVLKAGKGWRCRNALAVVPTHPLKPEMYRLHKLIEINPEMRRGVCQHCGPVDLNRNGTGDDGVQLWRCQFAHKIKSLTKPKKQHVLSEIDAIAKTAICAKCGPVKVVVSGGHKNKTYWRCLTAVRLTRLSSIYKLSEEGEKAMLARQDHVCAICFQAAPEGERLAVDHDGVEEKRTGKMVVRAMLCRFCNVGLGHFSHDPDLLRAAARYLEFHAIPSDPTPAPINHPPTAPNSPTSGPLDISMQMDPRHPDYRENLFSKPPGVTAPQLCPGCGRPEAKCECGDLGDEIERFPLGNAGIRR